jgi:hypothetical protein
MEERQYEDLVRRAQERRRMLETRRQELERRMRDREEYSGPGEPVWWDDDEEEEYEAPLREEMPSPWIEQHERPVQSPAPPRRQEEPRVMPAAPMQRQEPASARRRRNRLAMLETREGLLQAIVVREVLGPPVALRPLDQGWP